MLTRPPYDEWADITDANARLSETWDFAVAGVSAAEFRTTARLEAAEAASVFSSRLRVPVRSLPSEVDRVVVTGHQPELYHPGVWVKDFLLQRVADKSSAVAIDLVVDTDSFVDVSLRVPSLEPVVTAVSHSLAIGESGRCFATTSVPDDAALSEFCDRGASTLSALPATAPGRHFAQFCTHLHGAAADAHNLAELVTFARRRFEASAGSDYLELPVSVLSRLSAFARYSFDIMRSAERFARSYNNELSSYRAIHKTRSAAQPFPDLGVTDAGFEIPFWYVGEASRRPLFVVPLADGLELLAEDERLVVLPNDPEVAISLLLDLPGIVAPKAIALTLYSRMFLADMFIHGVGGGRYDRIADGVIRRFYAQEPPVFTVASMTMYLPLGAAMVGDEDVTRAEQKLHRFEHNPDEALDGIECESLIEREAVGSLSREKTTLVARIAQPDADRKTLGIRIREINRQLRELLAPVAEELRADLEKLKSERDATEILTDRTYPFCLWDPSEIRDKVL
ncbi:MAG: hypothetical protein PF636_10890 [Actinomycetota bacterium]|nr:hypothetical protein [Actinomycetota bacterium]